MKELVQAARAFADPSRVRILMALRKRELCVCELCDALCLTQSTLSTHLQVIRRAGLVSARKQGKWMYYAISPVAERLLRAWFQAFAGPLRRDSTLRRDAGRLRNRLDLRRKGSCCVGFTNGKAVCGAGK